MLPRNVRIRVPLHAACVPEVTISKLHVCNSVKKNQLDAQLILSVFRQHLHVSGVSRPIIRRYNRMYEYKTIGTYYSF